MLRNKLYVCALLVVVCVLFYKNYSFTSASEGNREGFTELLYSKVRPHARSARFIYEETLEKALKHLDRIMYNLGKR